MVMIDDCHATGFLGATGRGTHEYRGVMGHRHHHRHARQGAGRRVRRLHLGPPRTSSTWLRQRSRPYLFSNSLAPPIVAASIAVLDLLEATTAARATATTRVLPCADDRARLRLLPGEHPIIPVMLGDAKLAGDMADKLLERASTWSAFSYPVVPKGEARIRTQMSAGTRVHTSTAPSTRSPKSAANWVCVGAA
jgi:glycine C-acetyltransferase